MESGTIDEEPKETSSVKTGRTKHIIKRSNANQEY
jgi:hypothetical protein